MSNDLCPLRNIITKFKVAGGLSPDQLSNMACLKSDDCFWWDGTTCAIVGSPGVEILGSSVPTSEENTIAHSRDQSSRYVSMASRVINYLAVGLLSGTAGNKMIMAIYADDGAGYPGAQIGVTSEYTILASDYRQSLVLPLTVPVALVRGTPYWIAYNTENNNLGVYFNNNVAVLAHGVYKARAYDSTMPDPFPAGGAAQNMIAMSGIV